MSRSCGHGRGSMSFNLCTDCGYCTRLREEEERLRAEGKCVNCKGEGTVLSQGQAWDTNAPFTYSETCRVCKGTGNNQIRGKKMKVTLYEDNLKDEFKGRDISKIRFAMFNENAQQVIMGAGKALFKRIDCQKTVMLPRKKK